jgi:hypothetical protein
MLTSRIQFKKEKKENKRCTAGHSNEGRITTPGDVIGYQLVSINFFYQGTTMYLVEGIDKKTLATIRADPGGWGTSLAKKRRGQ